MSDIQILVIPWGSVLASLAFGYLLGSTPFGLLLTRAAGLGDVRKIGSGNIGATNVLRTGHKGLAALTLLLDALKGTAAVVIAGWIAGRNPGVATGFDQFMALGLDQAMAAGFGAFLGDLFPLWLRFKGGKGVATYLGVLAGLACPVALVFALVWLAMAFLMRYSSLAALVASLVVPVALYFMGLPEVAALFVVMTIIVWIKHRANIKRLVAGTESRIGAKG